MSALPSGDQVPLAGTESNRFIAPPALGIITIRSPRSIT
jgi:hypothetical protein